MLWRKLNYLVPEPKCETLDNSITEWTDSRPQPSQAEIDAVSEADIVAREDQESEDRFDFPDVMITVAKAFHNLENRTRTLEGKPEVTLRQVVKALRTL